MVQLALSLNVYRDPALSMTGSEEDMDALMSSNAAKEDVFIHFNVHDVSGGRMY